MTTENPKHSAKSDVEEEQTATASDELAPHQAEDGEHSEEAKHSNEGGHAEQTSGEQHKATHAKARNRNRRGVRIALVVVGVIVALCLIVVAALGWFVNSGKDELLADNETSGLRQTISRDGKSYVFNEDMVTVAMIGTDRLYGFVIDDEARGHADAIMLVAYDTSTGKVTLINVPRNTITRFCYTLPINDEDMLETFISAAFAYGSTDDESAELVCAAVSDLMSGLPVENYVVLLESSIAPLTEAMGGVTVTAVDNVSQAGVTQGGTYTLSGKDALLYVQYRNTNMLSSPTDRMRRQHDFAQAFLHQSIDAIKKDPSVLGKFYDILTDPNYMTTNLQLNELAYLASAVVTNGVNSLDLVTLPYEVDYDPVSTMVGYLPDHTGIMDILLDVYYKPVE